MILQPTSPARSYKDINSVIKILKRNSPDSYSALIHLTNILVSV